MESLLEEGLARLRGRAWMARSCPQARRTPLRTGSGCPAGCSLMELGSGKRTHAGSGPTGPPALAALRDHQGWPCSRKSLNPSWGLLTLKNRW